MIRLSRAQSREIDRICIEEYGLPGIVLMENAARSAAEEINFRLRGDGVDGTTAVIVCGGGNNGGDGFAVARHLENCGWHTSIVSLKPIDQLRGDAAVMAAIAQKSRTPISMSLEAVTANPDHLLIDAITGTGLSRPLDGLAREAVRRMCHQERTIVALDLPSGLDCDTGEPLGDACIRADLTITFVAEKLGFANATSRAYTGDIVVADIGCPRAVIDRVLRP